jgi:predicted NBD/HSP70 family sugar kinase
MRLFVGLDVSSAKIAICVVSEHGKIVKEAQVASEPDLAPKFYPVLSSSQLLDVPGWAVGVTGAGAEPSA